MAGSPILSTAPAARRVLADRQQCSMNPKAR
jgi:hypothetical protein